MDDVALREAAAATVRDAVHGPEPFDARRIVAARESEERFAERRRERLLREWRRGDALVSMRGSAANARAAAVVRPAAANAIIAWMIKNGRTPAAATVAPSDRPVPASVRPPGCCAT